VGLSMYGDPDALDRLAHRLQARAADIRLHADDHVRQGQADHWVSVWAQAYRNRIAKDRVDADQAAAELEQAAVVLRAHAQHIRETIALIAKYEKAATGWFEHQVRSLTNTVEQAVDSAERVIKSLVNDPPWKTWPIGPHSLPASGDVKWLEVGSFMRKQGVL
jgi:hypothetical protein